MCNDTLDIKKISNGILLRMDELGITPGELAIESGCTESTISRYCNLKINKPSLSEIAKLAKALDVSIDWLCFGDSEEENERNIHEQMDDYMSRLIDQAKAQVDIDGKRFILQALHLALERSNRIEEARNSKLIFKKVSSYRS